MEYVDSCHLLYTPYPPERPRDFNGKSEGRPVTPVVMQLAAAPSRTNYPPIYPFAYLKLLQVQTQIIGVYLSVEQVSQILISFPGDSSFVRVACFISLFGCIVDFNNISHIYDDILNDSERIEVR